MKETGLDSLVRFKNQTLMLEYHELRKETELKRRKLEMIKQNRLTLIAEVRFLRRRYKHLKQDQTLQNSTEMLRLSEPVDLEIPSGKSKHFGLRASVPCFDSKLKNIISNEKEALLVNDTSRDLEKKLKRSRENEVSTNSILISDPEGFDLNQISREEEEPEANGAEVMKNTMFGNGEIKLPMNRAVKRKVSWQDPVALSV